MDWTICGGVDQKACIHMALREILEVVPEMKKETCKLRKAAAFAFRNGEVV